MYKIVPSFVARLEFMNETLSDKEIYSKIILLISVTMHKDNRLGQYSGINCIIYQLFIVKFIIDEIFYKNKTKLLFNIRNSELQYIKLFEEIPFVRDHSDLQSFSLCPFLYLIQTTEA